MVRCLGVFLVLALLLCGCAGEKTELPDNTTKSTNLTQSTSSTDNIVEQITTDAVKTHELGGTGYYGCVAVADKLILMQEIGGEGVFSVYQEEPVEFVKEIRLGQGVAPTLEQIQVNEQGISYFDSMSKTMVFLNNDLIEIGRMHLNEDMEGDAFISEAWQMVYYCSEKGIHAMDLQSGISRLLKEQTAFRQEVTGCFGASGEILRCEVEITEGQEKVQLIDANSGSVLHEGQYLNNLITRATHYFLPRNTQGVRRLQFGEEGSHHILWPTETGGDARMLFENHAIVMLDTADGKTKLSYYDLETGKRISSITLPDVIEVCGVCGDGEKGLWLLGKDAEEVAALYYWDAQKYSQKDDTIHTAMRYTLDNPDTDGLAIVSKQATALSNKLGVGILIWNDAVNVAPADHVFTAEHSTQIYDHYLPKLEELLSGFPKELLTQAVGEKLRLALVHEIAGEPMWGSLAQSNSLQYWSDDGPVIALVLDENLEQNFYHGMYHFMETRILSKSSALYEWNTLNPKGFEYDNNYITNQERADITYIEGDNRYFIDLFSMSYAKEDRARIFEYACTPGNEELFKSSVLQTKLRRICNGIRTAFEITDTENSFLWEQYLTK